MPISNERYLIYAILLTGANVEGRRV